MRDRATRGCASPRAAAAAGLVALMLATAGCGGSSSHSGTAAVASSSTTPGSSATTTAPTASRTTTAPTSHSSTTRTTPPPPPSGTPGAPDGLRPSSGYGTYELCAGECSGAVPASLRRPLHLPPSAGPCAAPAGAGPVRPLNGAQLQISPFVGSSWQGGRVSWVAASSYSGPVLIRGRQLGGPGAVGFGEGHVPYDELQLLGAGSGAPSPPGGGRAWLTFTRVPGPGCYAYQVDGTSFSTVIAFRAAG